MMQRDGESTPASQRHPPSGEMPSADLLNYQLKELRDGQNEWRRESKDIRAILQRIEGSLRDGSVTMQEHERQIKAIRAAALKASASLITGGSLVTWEVIKHVLHL